MADWTIKEQKFYAHNGVILEFSHSAAGSTELFITDAAGRRRVWFTGDGEVISIRPCEEALDPLTPMATAPI